MPVKLEALTDLPQLQPNKGDHHENSDASKGLYLRQEGDKISHTRVHIYYFKL